MNSKLTTFLKHPGWFGSRLPFSAASDTNSLPRPQDTALLTPFKNVQRLQGICARLWRLVRSCPGPHAHPSSPLCGVGLPPVAERPLPSCRPSSVRSLRWTPWITRRPRRSTSEDLRSATGRLLRAPPRPAAASLEGLVFAGGCDPGPLPDTLAQVPGGGMNRERSKCTLALGRELPGGPSEASGGRSPLASLDRGPGSPSCSGQADLDPSPGPRHGPQAVRRARSLDACRPC